VESIIARFSIECCGPSCKVFGRNRKDTANETIRPIASSLAVTFGNEMSDEARGLTGRLLVSWESRTVVGAYLDVFESSEREVDHEKRFELTRRGRCRSRFNVFV